MNKLQWVEFDKGIHLTHRIYRNLLFVLLVLLAGNFKVLFADDSTGVSNTAVIRLQLQSIADEVIDRAKLNLSEHVAVFVEGEACRSLAENAFIEALQKRNCASTIGTETSAPGQTLQIFILDVNIKVRELDKRLYERNIHTTLEVKKIAGSDLKTDFIGTFSRQTADTAKSSPPINSTADQGKEEKSVIRRLLTPLVVIGGAVMIIYLFFTVRS